MIFLAILLVSVAIAGIAWRIKGGERGQWIASCIFSLGCCVAIFWGIRDAPRSRLALAAPGEVQVQTDIQTKQHFESISKATGVSLPNQIPTGIFIQSVQFLNPFTVWTTGYVWQRLPIPMPAGVEPGVNFPEGAETTMTEYFKEKQKNPTTGQEEEVICWYFETKFREQFDYQNYPFDKQNMWIRIWPKQFYSNTNCVPDFQGYSKNALASNIKGIDSGIVVESWKIAQTYYSFRSNKYDTNFGLGDTKYLETYPELYFNLEIHREIEGPIISFLMPPFIVLLIIYAILVSYKTNADKIGSVPDMATVLGSVAAMVFVLLVADDAARKAIETQSLTFTGILYCISYLACILLTLYILSSTLKFKDEEKESERRQDVKQLFWPIVTLMIAITVWLWL
jgi:hypothetical protein